MKLFCLWDKGGEWKMIKRKDKGEAGIVCRFRLYLTKRKEEKNEKVY